MLTDIFNRKRKSDIGLCAPSVGSDQQLEEPAEKAKKEVTPTEGICPHDMVGYASKPSPS